MKRHHHLLKVILILIPLIVLFVHLFLVTTTPLTRWKTGGFGMYTDAHPNLRYMLAQDSTGNWVKIYPLKKQEILAMDESTRSRFRESADNIRQAIYYPPKTQNLLFDQSYVQHVTGLERPNLRIMGIELDLEQKQLIKKIIYAAEVE
jgi:hypothetical protein